MVNLSLTEEQEAIIHTVRAFVERELIEREPELLQRGIESVWTSPGLTRQEKYDLQQRARGMGLWGIGAPPELGGAELDHVTQTLINIELGRTFLSFDFGGDASPLLYRCSPEQRESYLYPVLAGDKEMCTAISEPGGGSDVRSMKTTAQLKGDSYVLRGTKMWISRGLEADFAVVFARCTGTTSSGEIAGFLVDREMGWEATHIPTMGTEQKVAVLHFDNVRVPRENLLEEEISGYQQLMDWVYRNRVVRVAPKLIGASERLLSMGVEWAQTREVFGKPLSQYENWAQEFGSLDVEIRASKLLAIDGAWKISTGQDFRHEAYAVKLHAARMAQRTVDSVLQIHGGMGYAMESPIERWYRDLRVARIYEGSDEVNAAGIARNLFKGNVSPGAIF